MDATELARMYHAKGDNAAAESLFKKLFVGMPEKRMMQSDPEGYVALMQEAAVVAQITGKPEQHDALRAKAQKLFDKDPKISLPKDWTPYGLRCKSK